MVWVLPPPRISAALKPSLHKQYQAAGRHFSPNVLRISLNVESVGQRSLLTFCALLSLNLNWFEAVCRCTLGYSQGADKTRPCGYKGTMSFSILWLPAGLVSSRIKCDSHIAVVELFIASFLFVVIRSPVFMRERTVDLPAFRAERRVVLSTCAIASLL